MDALTSSYIAGLAASLSSNLLHSLGRRLKGLLGESEEQKAFQRCIRAGIIAVMETISQRDRDEVNLLADIFTQFFKDEDVAKELVVLVKGQQLDHKELAFLFGQSGFDQNTLPDLQFNEVISLFETAFVLAASREESLRAIIQTQQLLEQTTLQGQILENLKNLVELLNQTIPESLHISGGRITAQQINSQRVLEHRTIVNVDGTLISGNIQAKTVVAGDVGQIINTDKYIAIHPLATGEGQRVDTQALRRGYLNRLFDHAQNLSLAGIDPKAASEAENRLNLDAVYTALLTLTPEESDKLAGGKIPEKDSRQLSALEHLNRHQKLVLLGDPGSGKSTFVNFVTLCLAGASLKPNGNYLQRLTTPLPPDKESDKSRPQSWQHGALFPVRIILRDFSARGIPPVGKKSSARHLWEFIAAELAEANLDQYAPVLKQELLEEGGLILLDGLDEVLEAENRRTQILETVEDFGSVYEKCRFLVTTRTYAYQKQDWKLRNFNTAILAPFHEGQIRQFIDLWYTHIGNLRGLHQDESSGKATLLQNAIFSSDRLRGLAERPLLLTLMASLHAWRGGSLPERREELYHDTVDLLLDWWEKPKIVNDASGKPVIQQPSLAEWLKVDRQKVRDLLNELAFNAHAKQPDLIGTADIAEGDLVCGLMHLNPEAKKNPAELVDYLSWRAGLLLPRGVKVYTFPHRTFQEYLAACYLTDYDFPDKIVQRVLEDPNRWREVALLAAAKAGRGTVSSVWNIVNALCYKDLEASKITLQDAWGAHIAGQILVESDDLAAISAHNKPIVERIKHALVNILRFADFPASERAQAGVTLAWLGDPRQQVLNVDKMEFCSVPQGSFCMGSDLVNDEKPEHLNDLLDYDYYVSRFPITNAQYAEFVSENGYQCELYWSEAKKRECGKMASLRPITISHLEIGLLILASHLTWQIILWLE